MAPAGNYESFLGAVAAGADAVYLAGTKYGARAYADNFTEEEILMAVSYAHVFGRKVYLTVNTLLKDEELRELPAYLEPYAAAGLDGVIVQDLGALLVIREHFPRLALHVSTQMSLTGEAGAELLKELGAVRIVPARELSLEEIRRIKEKTGLEIETFIHGAMCYSYSGQCLFSSILGGRSGNRGRCAQPCRLPFRMENGGECYPLSMKDRCTVSVLPALIEAGIDSFKIEGRMKKPEYAAGVTAVYRKYLDLYLKKGKEHYRVEKEDMEMLASLYIRSSMQEGYYFKQNGKEMITWDSPSYNGCDETLLEQIRHRYLDAPLKQKITMQAGFSAGENAWLVLQTTDREGRLHRARVEGMLAEEARRQPVSADNIKNALLKLGNTPFTAGEEDLEVYADGAFFYPLKALNELRRAGVAALLKTFSEKAASEKALEKTAFRPKEVLAAAGAPRFDGQERSFLRVLVSSREQLQALLESQARPDILYLESGLAVTKEQIRLLRQERDAAGQTYRIFLALPYVVRSKDRPRLEKLLPAIKEADGVLVRNLETYAWLRGVSYRGETALDEGIYCFNGKTLDFWEPRVSCICRPYELNRKEWNRLSAGRGVKTGYARREEVVYGRLPLMVSANCAALTFGRCKKADGRKERPAGQIVMLKDRMGKTFPVITDCGSCCNVLYNSLPLSLHETVAEGPSCDIRLAFTVETGQETEEVLGFFDGLLRGERPAVPYREYTRGHEKRGVE